jgi:hypothetical protein
MIQGVFEYPWGWLFSRVLSPLGSFNIGMWAYIAGFISKWGAAWLILVLVDPSWLPGDTAVTTAAQVLPALMVSVFVFIFGSLFVVTQQATTIHSNRASLLLIYDLSVQRIVVRGLVMAVATLVLAVIVPDRGVSPEVSAFTLVLIVATAFTLIGAAVLLPILMSQTTAPGNFALFALDRVGEYLATGATGLVVFRVGALGEMLKRGVRSGDSLQIREALRGLRGLHEIYVEVAGDYPGARTHQYDNRTAEGWLGDELVPFLVSAGQDAIGLDIANEDCNAIAGSLNDFGHRSAQAGHKPEFLRAADGLCQMATCTQQAQAPGLFNQYAEPIFGLASLAKTGSTDLDEESGAVALAEWGLTIAYAMRHFGGYLVAPVHPHWQRSIELFGKDAPFRTAHEVVDSELFQRKWGNQLVGIPPELEPSADPPRQIGKGGVGAVHEFLDQASAAARELGAAASS